MITVKAEVKGPLFDARGPDLVRQGLEASTRAIAIEGRRLAVDAMMGSFRHPTPRYWTTVHAQRVDPTLWRVTDTGLPYGHWLEGSGSRNFPVTRFRGYRSFRRAALALAQRLGPAIERAFARPLRELGGGR